MGLPSISDVREVCARTELRGIGPRIAGGAISFEARFEIAARVEYTGAECGREEAADADLQRDIDFGTAEFGCLRIGDF